MSILINMEMPNKKNGAVLIIYPDGKCAFEDGKTYQAVPVPPHGALIDRDDFFAACPELVDGYKRITDDLVVIPAEEGET